MPLERVAGKIEVTANGRAFDLVGDYTLNLGRPKREGQMGPNQRHQGYKETAQIPSVKGKVRKSSSLNITQDLLDMVDATVVVEGPDNTRYLYQGAYYSGDGDIELENGEVQLEVEAVSATEIAP